MNQLHAASRQWATRPPEERFISLQELNTAQALARRRSRSIVVSNRSLTVTPVGDMVTELGIAGPAGNPTRPTHWAFGQLATKVGAPAGFLRTLRSPIKPTVSNWSAWQGTFCNSPLRLFGQCPQQWGHPQVAIGGEDAAPKGQHARFAFRRNVL